MFGYITINKSELKFKEYDIYHEYYCGLCRSLKDRYSAIGQLTLSYDMTFLAMLLTSLYEPHSEHNTCRCITHPFSSHNYISNIYIDYVADMNILLSYYKCLDDWQDEHALSKKLFSSALHKATNKYTVSLDGKIQIFVSNLELLHEQESASNTNIDEMAGYFGNIMSEIFAYKTDEWVFQLLTMIAADTAREFEKLPILDNINILRNILYSGIWTRYQVARERRNPHE